MAVVAATANGDISGEARAEGADEVLLKPINPNALVGPLISSSLDSRELARRNHGVQAANSPLIIDFEMNCVARRCVRDRG